MHYSLKTATAIPFILLLTGMAQLSYGQAGISLSDPVPLLRDNVIEIGYDIVNGEESREYTIALNVWDENGRILQPVTVTGDVGSGIKGGGSKQIQWDLGADGLFLDSRIYIEITARSASGRTREMLAVSNPSDITLPSAEKEVEREALGTVGVLAVSLALPGLGMSRVTGDPHWIRGAAGYSFLAGALFLNERSMRNYREIVDYPDFETREELFKRSVRQDQVSEVLAITAIGIWVADFVWNVAGMHHHKKGNFNRTTGNLRFEPGLDPYTRTPLVGMTFHF